MIKKNGYFLLIIFGLLLLSLSACQPKDLTQMDEWDMIYFSNSNGWGVADQLAGMINDEMGIKVNVSDFAIGSINAKKVLAGFEGTSMNADLDKLSELMSEAEYVVVNVSPSASGFESKAIDTCFARCGSDLPAGCPIDEGTYRDDLRAIYDQIFLLKNGQPVIVRAIGLYNPLIADWQECGIAEQCNECWVKLNQIFIDVAAEYNVPFADVLRAYNGESLMEDPREKGYIREDGEHPTELGSKAEAEVLFDLGFEPVVPE